MPAGMSVTYMNINGGSITLDTSLDCLRTGRIASGFANTMCEVSEAATMMVESSDNGGHAR